tara:strand:- start:1162 stop:1524 length:363 start_codon:yes stop_codon:yes gene_type:complete
MERFIVLVIVFISFNSILSQEVKDSFFDSSKELEEFLEDQNNLNFLNENGFYFVDIPKGKSYSNRLAGTILLNDTSKIDVNKLKVNFLMNDYQYYLVSNLNILLVLKSIDHIKKKMNSIE